MSPSAPAPLPEGLLLLSHPVLAPIGEDKMLEALPEAWRDLPRQKIQMDAVRAALSDVRSLDWQKAQREQRKQFDLLLRPALRWFGGYRIVYFGLAPIPLAMQLGHLIGGVAAVDVHMLHHERRSWLWSEASGRRPTLLPVQTPMEVDSTVGDLIVRVSTAARIDPSDTRAVIPRALFEMDIALEQTGRDVLERSGDVDAVAQAFGASLDVLTQNFPKARIHVFAAVPVGLAFRMGTYTNPTMHLPIQTYQYHVASSPRYIKAIGHQDEGAMVEPAPAKSVVHASDERPVVVRVSREGMQKITLGRAIWWFDPSKRLGEKGGSGAVFAGRSSKDEPVAVKRVASHAFEIGRRELEVARELVGRDWRHVIPVLDSGVDLSTRDVFVVMARARRSLADRIRDAVPVPETEAVDILLHIAEGLVELGNIVHRDLKPQNVLEHHGTWKIADFGIARLVDETSAENTVREHRTPAYAAPEQLKGQHATKAADVHALACIAYTLLTGRVPPRGAGERVEVNPAKLGASIELRQIIEKCLANAPGMRPSAVEVHDALRRIRRGPLNASAVNQTNGQAPARR